MDYLFTQLLQLNPWLQFVSIFVFGVIAIAGMLLIAFCAMNYRRNAVNDAARLDELEKLLASCPHAEITYNEDPDAEWYGAPMPLGFMIRIEGCETSVSSGPTLRDCLDQEILANKLRRYAHLPHFFDEYRSGDLPNGGKVRPTKRGDQ